MQMDSIGAKIYMPAAFVGSLEANPAALHAFFRMSPEQQDSVISRVRRLQTQEEMKALLQDLVKE